jgi:hypothetical protein
MMVADRFAIRAVDFDAAQFISLDYRQVSLREKQDTAFLQRVIHPIAKSSTDAKFEACRSSPGSYRCSHSRRQPGS